MQVAIVAAGFTAETVTGETPIGERDRIIAACELGGSTIFGTGLNPGFIELFAIVSAGLSDRIDRVCIVESFDTTIYNSPETEKIMGFGYPIDHPGLPAVTEEGSGIFREAVLIVAEALGVELDEIRCQAEYAQATEDVRLPGDWVIAKGCVAGIDVSWRGFVGERDVIEVRGVWTKGQSLEPTWTMGFGYNITVEGRPTIKTTLAFEPPADFVAETIEDYVLLGLTITAVPAITAIPAVVAAPPGIATYNDLPLLLPRGVLNV